MGHENGEKGTESRDISEVKLAEFCVQLEEGSRRWDHFSKNQKIESSEDGTTSLLGDILCMKIPCPILVDMSS